MAPHSYLMLISACEAAGVELGAYDKRIAGLAHAGYEPQTCAVIAGWVQRASQARPPPPPPPPPPLPRRKFTMTTCDHARPGLADQRAALAVARAVLNADTGTPPTRPPGPGPARPARPWPRPHSASRSPPRSPGSAFVSEPAARRCSPWSTPPKPNSTPAASRGLVGGGAPRVAWTNVWPCRDVAAGLSGPAPQRWLRPPQAGPVAAGRARTRPPCRLKGAPP